MTTEAIKTIRIFISSPNDVQDERIAAKDVVQELGARYSGKLELHTIFWEDLPLEVHEAFQVGIDRTIQELQEKGGFDVAIFILWSRLGQETIALKTPNGPKEYPSGTVREWETMMGIREANLARGNGPHPTIFLYVRKNKDAFDLSLKGKPTSDQKERIRHVLPH